MSNSLKELLKFVQLGARLDLKIIAMKHILGLTGHEDGVETILMTPESMVSLLSLLRDQNKQVSTDASLCLVNISAGPKGAAGLLDLDMNRYCLSLQVPPNNIIQELLDIIFNRDSHITDQCCMILSNITRHLQLIENIVGLIMTNEENLDKLINIFGKSDYNKVGCKLHYLGPVLSNLTQSHTTRLFILDRKKNHMQRLILFMEYRDSLVRRGGIVGTVKNCCFEEDFHEWLLSNDVDILPRLLLPLAGNEDFDEEDNDKLPIELQYLPTDKVREEDPDIRCMLLEALTQLVIKRPNRELIRNKNAYVILRELHKWEKDKVVISLCEGLINILLRTEDEIGLYNLKTPDMSEEIQEEHAKSSQNN